jgi:hypothetical protein
VIGNGGEGNRYRDIKLHLVKSEAVPAINAPDSKIESDVLAVAFLALALRRSRTWFFMKHSSLYGKFLLVWHFNLGLPSADYADLQLSAVYKRISQAAWWLSTEARVITVDAAKAALARLGNIEEHAGESVAEIQIIPEVAAEVLGYARSHLRDEGLHVLVDIGASTLDVCGFILHAADGDDCYELLTADVQHLGTMALYRRPVLGVHKAVEAHVAELWSKCDPVKAIPETSNEYLPHSNMLEKYVTNAGEQYEGECRRMLWKTIVDLKTRRDPRSPRWRGELPLFVCGGGSAMAFYHDAISKLSGQLASFYTGCEGIKKCLLPKPEQLVAEIDAQNYHRLAVAWGLSYPEYDIGSVTRPGETEDVAPPKQIERREESWER